MFKFAVVVALLGLVAANHLDKNAQVKSFQNDVQSDGSYHYSYQISNGISGQHSGNADGATGESSHISPEGETIQLRYTADENGFHPEGNHLPTPPPIPAYILKSLEYIRTHQPKEPTAFKRSATAPVAQQNRQTVYVAKPSRVQASVAQPNRQAFLAPF